MATTFGAAAPGSPEPTPAAIAQAVEQMASQMAELRAQLDRQAATITAQQQVINQLQMEAGRSALAQERATAVNEKLVEALLRHAHGGPRRAARPQQSGRRLRRRHPDLGRRRLAKGVETHLAHRRLHATTGGRRLRASRWARVSTPACSV